MKKIFIGILLNLIVLSSFSQGSESSDKKITRLILVHPTEYNLKLFNYLIENKIVSVDNLEIIGLYHKKEIYDYSQSIEYLKNKGIKYVQLRKINEEISPESLYQTNNCSEIFNELFNQSNGILFLGGPDIPPAIYNEETNLKTEILDPSRHYFEASFLFHLLGGNQNSRFKPLLESNPEYTVYGICLGMQTMNIATGGTMIQDIPSELYQYNSVEQILKADANVQHRNYNNNISIDEDLFPGSFHEIKMIDSRPIIGNEKIEISPLVYSNHHQAIEKQGRDFQIIASSVDGKIVEAISHKKFPNVLGIQFHPEGTFMYNPEVKYKKSNNDSLVSGYEIISKQGSHKFHIDIWKEFSRKLCSVNNKK